MIGWEKLDWAAFEGVDRITLSLEHQADKVIAEIDYGTGRKDVVVFVKQLPGLSGSAKG